VQKNKAFSLFGGQSKETLNLPLVDQSKIFKVFNSACLVQRISSVPADQNTPYLNS